MKFLTDYTEFSLINDNITKNINGDWVSILSYKNGCLWMYKNKCIYKISRLPHDHHKN